MSSGSDEPAGLTPSVAKLQRILGTSPSPRMLTPYEIELLRESKREISEAVGQILAAKKDPSQSSVATEEHQVRCSGATRQRGRKPG